MAAHLVNAHQLAAPVLPVDGAPRTAANVRIIQEVIRALYNAHDGDYFLHIQQGLAADRPAFGNAGSVFLSTDTKIIELDTGTAWVALGYALTAHTHSAADIASDILAVDRGGTGSGAYTKGDILVASAAAVLTKLAVGTNNKALIADSAQATGVKWGDVAVLAAAITTGRMMYSAGSGVLDDTTVIWENVNTAMYNPTQPSQTWQDPSFSAANGANAIGVYTAPSTGWYLVTLALRDGGLLNPGGYIDIAEALFGYAPLRFLPIASGGGNTASVAFVCQRNATQTITLALFNGSGGPQTVGFNFTIRLLV